MNLRERILIQHIVLEEGGRVPPILNEQTTPAELDDNDGSKLASEISK